MSTSLQHLILKRWNRWQVGWFGFNAGSALTAGGSAAMAMLVTHIAASVAGLSWMVTCTHAHTHREGERERERERDVAISLNRTHVAASHLKSHPCDDVLLVGAARCLLSVVPGVCCVSHCACARACVPSASASPLQFPSSSPPRSRSAFPLRSCSSTPRSRFASPMRSSSFPRRS